jgi:hypothetical protein
VAASGYYESDDDDDDDYSRLRRQNLKRVRTKPYQTICERIQAGTQWQSQPGSTYCLVSIVM